MGSLDQQASTELPGLVVFYRGNLLVFFYICSLIQKRRESCEPQNAPRMYQWNQVGSCH